MANENLGLKIRDFFHDLLGSRLALAAETAAYQLRGDYETRLAEKDQLISVLNSRISNLEGKVDRYELVLIPLTSPAAGLFGPKKERQPFVPITDTKSSWEAFQDDYYAQQAQESETEKAAQEKVQS